MTEQLSIEATREPEDVLAEAEELGPFVARLCLVSGGRDSTVLAHRCRDFYDEIVFIDTGTALPGVLEHAIRLADMLEKPIRVLTTPPSEYDRIVLGSDNLLSNGKPSPPLGFPGPSGHRICYTVLKERRLQEVTRQVKVGHHYHSHVLMLSGVRRAESGRRRSRPAVDQRWARVFAKPLIDWPASRMADYMEEHSLPESDVTALIHRSGECNCGSFAPPGEREVIRALFPEWFKQRIEPLERAARKAGLASAQWGRDEPEQVDVNQVVGELCDCQMSFEGLQPV